MQPEEIEVPNQFLCPILQSIMEDPVITTDGFTFERQSIQTWFNKGKKTNPMTNQKLESLKLVPNRSLKILINQFIEKMPPRQRDYEESNRVENLVNNLKKIWSEDTGPAKKELDLFKQRLINKKNYYQDNKHRFEGDQPFFVNEFGKYYGDNFDGLLNGIGLFLSFADEKYEGQWTDGWFNGIGIYYYNDGSKYQGSWMKAQRQGKGIMHYNDDAVYEGDWKQSKRQGRGIIYFNDGARYEGEWKNDNRLGTGIMYFNDGATYQGQWKNGLRNGKGVMKYNDGSKYVGYWKDGNREGRGSFKIDGTTYTGNWKNDFKHGKGTFYLSNGHKVEQEWDLGTQIQ